MVDEMVRAQRLAMRAAKHWVQAHLAAAFVRWSEHTAQRSRIASGVPFCRCAMPTITWPPARRWASYVRCGRCGDRWSWYLAANWVSKKAPRRW